MLNTKKLKDATSVHLSEKEKIKNHLQNARIVRIIRNKSNLVRLKERETQIYME